LGEVEETALDDIDAIFARARIAQREWRQVPVGERIQRVAHVTQYIADHFDDISLVISQSVGKPPAEAFIAEVYGAMDSAFLYYTTGEEIIGQREEIPLGFYNSLEKRSYLTYKPMGVVGVIGPYNFPFIIPFEQSVQALMAGNAVVFKPSSDVALVGQKIQDVFDSTDLPAGLMQTVYGEGSTVGNAVVEQANLVVFTGSTETGKRIMKTAVEHLTPVVLELGGKDAMVVFPDANLERAANAARWGTFGNSGQVCSSVKRLYVHTDIYDEFTNRLVELTRELKQGDPLEPGTDVGAMVNEEQLNKVAERVESAKEEGATVLIGGQRNPDLVGYFYEPTIIGNVRNDMLCAQQEIFGPVLVVIRFDTEEEVIDMVNSNPYGLTASVWTNDLEKGERLAHQIDAGTVMVNEVVYTFALAATPWGGPKNSGLGRTHGKLGFLSTMQPLHVNIDASAGPDMWWMPYGEDFQLYYNNFKEIAKKLVVK
jgi:succinate-semialdehyde dehydrogenase/glutarate-semialdehyde dehydrogenase